MTAITQGSDKGQLHDRIIGAQVIGPQEALLPQLDAGREEPEHGEQYRHLHQHGPAATGRIHPGFPIPVSYTHLTLPESDLA